MATWVTHLMVADRVLERVPELCRHEFCVGNIAPDCNVENEDWTQFTPPREVTHWMGAERKVASDCDRFYIEYIKNRKHLIGSKEELSCLLGYYSHLITDAEFQRILRDKDRVAAAWERIKQHAELSKLAVGMPENWDSVKRLINKHERMKDISTIEAEYIEEHPDSGYLTEIMGLQSFPDYIDYLPEGAIVRKIGVMGYLPEKEESQYPYVGMTREEYMSIVDSSVELVVAAIERHRKVQILYGTTNQAKLDSMKRIAAPLGIEIIGLKELGQPLPSVEETGNNPPENARIKAKAYYEAFSMPVFSCDSGLYFDELPEELQPGVHTRRVHGKELTDEEMQMYYGNLAKNHGGRLTGRYRNAIAFVWDEKTCFESFDEALATEPFWLVEKPHEKYVKGYPLDSLSIDIATGKYYYDMEEKTVDQSAIMQGFLKFFEDAFEKIRR